MTIPLNAIRSCDIIPPLYITGPITIAVKRRYAVLWGQPLYPGDCPVNTMPSTETHTFTLDRKDLKAGLILAVLGAFMSLIFAMAGALVSLVYLVLFGAAAAGLGVVAFNCLRGLKS